MLQKHASERSALICVKDEEGAPMAKKIRPIDPNSQEENLAKLSDEELEAKENEEVLQHEIAEFDRIAEILKKREMERLKAAAALGKKPGEAGEKCPKEELPKEDLPKEEPSFGDPVKEALAREIIENNRRIRESRERAVQKGIMPAANPAGKPAGEAGSASEAPMKELRLKHVSEDEEEADGTRLLVERVWPAGINRKSYPLTDWQPEIGPSFALRKAFSTEPGKFEAFAEAYRDQLEHDLTAIEFRSQIRQILQVENVTLIYSEGDSERNCAVALRNWVLE